MAGQFLRRCRGRINECMRLMSTDNPCQETLDFVITSLEATERAVQRALGSVIPLDSGRELLVCVEEFLAEVRSAKDVQLPQQTGYRASRIVQVGDRGSPTYNISREQLSFLVECGFGTPEMSSMLHVSVSTIKRRLREFNVGLKNFTAVTNNELDETISQLIRGNRLLGPNSVRSRLLGAGIKIQRWRVRESMLRIDPGAAAERAMGQRLHRRTYNVAGPNSLWHIDGNHKLIRWRIVIHGGIDGFSRLVVFCHASNNNRAMTVFESFVEAGVTYGFPSRVRCDHGGENNDICNFMELYRGGGRSSSIRGTSVHNQRIERLWVDMWCGVNNLYYDLFRFLEQDGILNPDNEHHIWALHYVFLPRINRDLTTFRNQWNNHGIRTAHHRTPMQIFVRDMLRLQNSQLTAVRDFSTLVHDDPQLNIPDIAGFDWNNVVEVPALDCPLTEEQMVQLGQSVDPLDDTGDLFGIDLFRRTLEMLPN